jgi:phenylpropionate dioxygenase-like ring-hydroxylating dioxygenase large terminal subunit
MKRVELKDGDVVFFTPRTDNYGTAEFEICPVWKRKKLSEVWIYPAQQPDKKEYYHISVGYSASFGANSWTHKGIVAPKVWMFFWCAEHKTTAMRLYVPHNSNCFIVSILSDCSIYFDHKTGGI